MMDLNSPVNDPCVSEETGATLKGCSSQGGGVMRLSKICAVVLLSALFLMIQCSSDEPFVPEVVPKCTCPSGPDLVEVDSLRTYETTEEKSTKDNELEYAFDWGDDNEIEWSPVPKAKHSWSSTGKFYVKVQARCRRKPGLLGEWSDSLRVVVVDEETVSTPDVPYGDTLVCVGKDADYKAGDAKCSKGHPVEYRFDWGDGDYSDWSTHPYATHKWLQGDTTYQVRAQARCAVNTSKLSEWSGALTVRVNTEVVTKPDKPVGPPRVCVAEPGEYNTGGAENSCGYSVEYNFVWGDGTQSGWSPVPSASHSWRFEGAYAVKVVARSAVHTNIVSGYSDTLSVTVSEETVSAPGVPEGRTSVCLSESQGYCISSDAVSSCGHEVEYSFDWGDGSGRSPWSTAKCASHTWRIKGTYEVTAYARCALHPDVESPASPALSVTAGDETVSAPTVLTGDTDLCIDELGEFRTGGAVSSCGHSVEYQFKWGNGDTTGWSSSSIATYAWNLDGIYDVTVRARCATHTGVISAEKGALAVVVGETIDPPRVPDGPALVCRNKIIQFSTGGAGSNCGHDIWYAFDWGDGSPLVWSDDTTASHSWDIPDVYEVTALAQCKKHTQITSSSAPLYVEVSDDGVYVTLRWTGDGVWEFGGNYPDRSLLVWDTEQVTYDRSTCWGLAWAAIFQPDHVPPTYNDATGFLYAPGENGIYVGPLTTAIEVSIRARFAGSGADERLIEVTVGSGTPPAAFHGERHCDWYRAHFDDPHFQPGSYVPVELRVPGGGTVAYGEVEVFEIRIEFDGWCLP